MKEFFKNVPKGYIILGLVFIFIMFLIFMPEEWLTKESSDSKTTGATLSRPTVASNTDSSDLGNINDKILSDNEKKGYVNDVLDVTSSTKASTSSGNSIKEIEDNRGTGTVSSDIISFAKSLDLTKLTFSYTDIAHYSEYKEGKNATFESVEILKNVYKDDFLMIMDDLVFVSFLDDAKKVAMYKLSPNSDDLIIIKHSYTEPDPSTLAHTKGSIYNIGLYLGNVSLQKYDNKNIVVATYVSSIFLNSR